MNVEELRQWMEVLRREHGICSCTPGDWEKESITPGRAMSVSTQREQRPESEHLPYRTAAVAVALLHKAAAPELSFRVHYAQLFREASVLQIYPKHEYGRKSTAYGESEWREGARGAGGRGKRKRRMAMRRSREYESLTWQNSD